MTTLNRRLLLAVEGQRPDVLLIYRGTHVFPNTVRRIKERSPRTLLATYNNDDPLSPRAALGLWRHYLGALRWTDLNLVYRQKSVEDLKRLGAHGVHLIRSAYLPAKDRPITVEEVDIARFGSDVVFAGHYEPDERVEFLRTVADSPWRFRLFGPDWQSAPRGWLDRFQPIQAVRGDDYVKAIRCARIALCFLSTLNHDTYTRRCFEIPAIGSLLLCQRTSDMEALFRPGLDADYFSTPGELRAKLDYYLKNEEIRTRVATNGHARVRAKGHDIFSRMREVEKLLLSASPTVR